MVEAWIEGCRTVARSSRSSDPGSAGTQEELNAREQPSTPARWQRGRDSRRNGARAAGVTHRDRRDDARTDEGLVHESGGWRRVLACVALGGCGPHLVERLRFPTGSSRVACRLRRGVIGRSHLGLSGQPPMGFIQRRLVRCGSSSRQRSIAADPSDRHEDTDGVPSLRWTRSGPAMEWDFEAVSFRARAPPLSLAGAL